MKKGFWVLMILTCLGVLCSLCACGNNESEKNTVENSIIDKSSSSSYIGRWDTQDFYLQIDKGGTASYRPIATPDDGYYDMKWEVIDDVIALDYESSIMNVRITLELNDDGTQLNQIGGTFIKYRSGNENAVFTKVK